MTHSPPQERPDSLINAGGQLMADWHNASDHLPPEGTRIIILYDDGSGATLGYWTGDTLFDSYGDERALFEDAGTMWAPLPVGFQLWCEMRADDPFTFPAANIGDKP